MGDVKKGTPAVAQYDFYKTNGSPRSLHDYSDDTPSMTRQEFAAECDINNIMKQYEKHIADPMRSIREPIYHDFTAQPSTLMEYMQVMLDGEQAFMTLPASVRREFDNDPRMFVDFAADPANIETMREWGLAAPAKPPEEPLQVTIVGGAPDPSPKGEKPLGEPGKPATHGST